MIHSSIQCTALYGPIALPSPSSFLLQTLPKGLWAQCCLGMPVVISKISSQRIRHII